jgi:flagellar protein FlaG
MGPKTRPAEDTGAPQAPPDSISASAKAPRAKAPAEDTREQLQALLEQVGDRMQPESRSLSFRINEDIDGVVVSVIDTETEELIRQIPAEAMVRIAETLQRIDASTANAGLLLSDKA